MRLWNLAKIFREGFAQFVWSGYFAMQTSCELALVCAAPVVAMVLHVVNLQQTVTRADVG